VAANGILNLTRLVPVVSAVDSSPTGITITSCGWLCR
jgi:hypothetical protein